MVENENEVKKALRERYDFFEECCNTRDPMRLVEGFYTLNAIMGGTGIDLTQGREAIRELVTGLVNAVSDVRVEMIELRPSAG